jgi:hypothetical protein
MNSKRLLVDFATVFALSLVVTAIVTLLGNLIVHGASTVDWETSFRVAILFGIISAGVGRSKMSRVSSCIRWR